MAGNVIAQHNGQGPEPWIAEPLQLESARLTYDAEFDSLGLMFGPKRAGSTVRGNTGVWWRIDPETGEIYGIEIQAFERHFLQTCTNDVQAGERMLHHWDALKANDFQGDESRIHIAHRPWYTELVSTRVASPSRH